MCGKWKSEKENLIMGGQNLLLWFFWPIHFFFHKNKMDAKSLFAYKNNEQIAQ